MPVPHSDPSPDTSPDAGPQPGQDAAIGPGTADAWAHAVADPHTDWFGNPVRHDGGRPYDPVPCPFCGEHFGRSAEFAVHVRTDHGFDHDAGRVPAVFPRLKRWLVGLKFMPLWFVLLLNIMFTALLYLAWGHDLALFSFTDQSAVLKTWIIRLSILPSILVLCWRTIDRPV